MPGSISGGIFDLLMAVMNSVAAWTAAAGDPQRGLEWRDAVASRIATAGAYRPYEALVAAEAGRLGLGPAAVEDLTRAWVEMDPWPDSVFVARLGVPFGFVTNCSTSLARSAAARSALSPVFVLSAEEIGWYKPHRLAYRAACRRLGTQAAETLYVAGSPYDAAGARAAGMRAVYVARRPDVASPGPAIPTVDSLEAIIDVAGWLS